MHSAHKTTSGKTRITVLMLIWVLTSSLCGERISDVVTPQGRCFTDSSIVGSLLVFWLGFSAKKSRVHWLAFQARFSSPPLVWLLATVKPLTIGCPSSSLWIHPSRKPLEIEMRERWGTGRKTGLLAIKEHQSVVPQYYKWMTSNDAKLTHLW